MRAIMERWISRGYKTVAQMEAGERKATGNAVRPTATTTVDESYADRIKQHMNQKNLDRNCKERNKNDL